MVVNKPKLVIDASVALKWITDEQEDLEQALFLKNLLQKRIVECLVPNLFFYEILNSLGKKGPSKSLRFFGWLKSSDVTDCMLTTDQVLKATELMEKYKKVSFYDTSYHALAMCENATFVTSDGKYYEMTKKEGHIILLKNFKM